jgi:Flp pilus assembly protein TadB
LITGLLIATAVFLLIPSSPLKFKSPKKKATPQQISAIFALVVLMFFPSLTGLLVSLIIFWWLPNLIQKLPTKSTIKQDRVIQQELDLTIDLIAVALAAGLSVLAALDAVAKVVQPKLGAELTAAANRLQWGADLNDAFSDQLQVIAAALGRAMDHGVGAGKALAEIAARTREQRKQELLRRTKKLAVTLALPVALLMLPGFVLLGVVPMVVPALSSLW